MERNVKKQRGAGEMIARCDSILKWLPPGLAERVATPMREAEARGEQINELRLRAERPASLTLDGENRLLSLVCSREEMAQTVMFLCGGSMHAHMESIRRGYITLPNGCRAGLCGHATRGEGESEGIVTAIRSVTSICLRLAWQRKDVCLPLYRRLAMGNFRESVLLYAPPGVGKTTLLRDLLIHLSSGSTPLRVAAVDSRGELEDDEALRGCLADVLHGYGKATGIEIATRTLSPQILLCDEIGGLEEATAILGAQSSGLPLIATTHGSELCRLLTRPGIALLHQHHIFDMYVGLERDAERLHFCFDSWKEAENRVRLCAGRAAYA